MITLDYAANNLIGAWKMAWGLNSWEERVDHSTDGVFLSFWAIAVAAPLSLLFVSSVRRAARVTPDFPETPVLQAPIALMVASDFIAFVLFIAISLFSLVMIARRLGAYRQISLLIVGFNWSQVFVGAILALPVTVMGITGSKNLAAALFLPAVAFSGAIFWGILRRSLPLNVTMTIAAIVLLMLISVITDSVVNGFALFAYQAFS